LSDVDMGLLEKQGLVGQDIPLRTKVSLFFKLPIIKSGGSFLGRVCRRLHPLAVRQVARLEASPINPQA